MSSADDIEVEYGIRWSAPADIADTITIVGRDIAGRQMAMRRAELAERLPGGMRGEVVYRTITWSGWSAA
jgi:hypothetical protein